MLKLDKILSIFLAVAIVVALGFIIYLEVTPKEDEKFTEFYILSTDGKAQNYPRQAISGEPVEIVLGVINHEYQTASYQVKIKIDDNEVKEINIDVLNNGERWENKISFIPQTVAKRQKVDFYLYKNDKDEPYLKEPLRLYINVISP